MRKTDNNIRPVIVRGKRNKQNRNFSSIFLLKARVLYLTILKRKSLSLRLNVDTDQFVTRCLPVKFQLHFTLGQWSESWRRWCRVSFSVVFSLFLPHLWTLTQEKRSETCLRFGTSGPSLCLYPLLSRNIILSPRYWTMAARAKTKISDEGFADAARTVEIWSTLAYTEFDCVTLLAML